MSIAHNDPGAADDPGSPEEGAKDKRPDEPEEGDHGAPAPELHGINELTRRLRRVRHLAPFRLDVREDGRFLCEVEIPPEQLSPAEAREILAALEPVVERLRERAKE